MNFNLAALWISVFTAVGYQNVASFPAFRTIIQAIGAEAHGMLALTDGAIFFASAVGLELAALHAKRRFGHMSPPANSTRAQQRHQGAGEVRAAVRLPVFFGRARKLSDSATGFLVYRGVGGMRSAAAAESAPAAVPVPLDGGFDPALRRVLVSLSA